VSKFKLEVVEGGGRGREWIYGTLSRRRLNGREEKKPGGTFPAVRKEKLFPFT
jgi:hypothetical protein